MSVHFGLVCTLKEKAPFHRGFLQIGFSYPTPTPRCQGGCGLAAHSFFFSETGFLCVALAVLELTVDQAGLELRNPSASASQVLGLKVCATTPGLAAHSLWLF